MVGSSHGEQFEARERATTAWVMAAVLGAAAVWIGWLLGWPWVIDMDHPDFNPMILIEGLLILLILWYVLQAIRWSLRSRSFGRSLIDIEGPVPVPLGGTMLGRVRTARPVRAAGDIRMVLTCFDVHERRYAAQAQAGSPHRREAFPVWSAEHHLSAATDSTQGLTFRFELPDSVGERPVQPLERPASAFFRGSISINIPGLRRIITRNRPPVARYWTLTVTAPTDGPDYRAEFAIPVEEA